MTYSREGISSHRLVGLVYLVDLIYPVSLVQPNNRAKPNKNLLPLADMFNILLARIIHECHREAFETEASRGFWHVKPTRQTLSPSRRANEKSSAGREDRMTQQVFMNGPG
jgi:hypothetical protein